MDYGDSKGLTRRTASDKILHHKAFNMDINVDLHQWSINFAMKLLHVLLLCCTIGDLSHASYTK